MSATPPPDEGKRERPKTRPVAERHAEHRETRRRMGLENSRGRTKLPPVLVEAVRSKKATASHAVLWAVVDHLSSLGRKRADCGHGSLGDAIGSERKRVERLLVDASPLFANLDGRGALLGRAEQDKGFATWYTARRKANGRVGGWAPTWTIGLVCDGASHERLVPERLVSPDAWLLYALLVWWAGEEGSCRRSVPELAEAVGRSPRLVQQMTRELRGAGLLLVRDRRGESRPGRAGARSSVYVPIVDRGGRQWSGERKVVDLLCRLPADLPADLAWSLDRLDPAGVVSSREGRVGFGGWAAWRALTVTGPVEVFPQVLADRFGVDEETAASWSEEAALAGLATVELSGVWSPVETPGSPDPEPSPTLEESDESARNMAHGLHHGMAHGLHHPMAHGLHHGMAHGLHHETSTPSSDPLHSGGLMSVSTPDVVSGWGDGVLSPPKAAVVTGGGRERPSAGPATRHPAPQDIDRVLEAPETRHLLLARMTHSQQAKARTLVAHALADPVARLTPERLAWRLTESLVGKSADDIRVPFAWLRSHLERKGCCPDCPCGRTDCERGLLWPTLEPCASCEAESAERLAQWRLKQAQEAQDAPQDAPRGPQGPVPPRERPAAVVRRLPVVPPQPDPQQEEQLEPAAPPPVVDMSDYVQQKTASIREAILAARINARHVNRT